MKINRQESPKAFSPYSISILIESREDENTLRTAIKVLSPYSIILNNLHNLLENVIDK